MQLLSKYMFTRNFIKLSAAIDELTCVNREKGTNQIRSDPTKSNFTVAFASSNKPIMLMMIVINKLVKRHSQKTADDDVDDGDESSSLLQGCEINPQCQT